MRRLHLLAVVPAVILLAAASCTPPPPPPPPPTTTSSSTSTTTTPSSSTSISSASTTTTTRPTAPVGCPYAPADSYWHATATALPRLAASDTYVTNAGATSSLHADFGSGLYDGGPIGIPFTTVGAGQRKVPVSFDYADESDPGPYPLPANAPIEGGRNADGDRHVLVVDRDACRLYELFDAHPGRARWHAGSGAIWNLRSTK